MPLHTRSGRALPGVDRSPVLVAARLLLAVLAVLVAWPSTAMGAPRGSAALTEPSVPGWGPDLGWRVTYAPPVDGAVVRPFDAPRTAFGAGHRGVDLDLSPGGAVQAAASGRVSFAGAVAGVRWVSLAHADGMVTTYGPLADLEVTTGEQVQRGDRLALLAPGGHGVDRRDHGLHWGARDPGGAYVDPLGLLDGDRRRPSLVGGGRWEPTAHVVTPYDPWDGGQWWGTMVGSSPLADRPGFAVAPNPNHLVLLPGLATSSDTTVLDPTFLGYPPESVTAFSYAGRSDGPGRPDDPRRDQLPYQPSDTWDGPGPAAQLLAEQLREQARREPGRAVDLIGHSMGGVVIWEYLVRHHDPMDRTLPPIGHVVTFGSPLRGSDAAVIGELLADDPVFAPFRGDPERPDGAAGRLPLDAPAVSHLASGSDEQQALARAWDRVLRDGTRGPLATGTRILTIGGSRDVVVTPHRTRQPATTASRQGTSGRVTDGDRTVVDHRVLPGGHSGVLATEAAYEVTWRFLAGEEVITSPGHGPTALGGELSNTAATAARALHLWAQVRAPFSRLPARPPVAP